MADREKVIKGLECCAIGLYCPDEDCPYEEAREAKDENCIAMLARDALELLKAQEPRVLTIEEVEALPYGHVIIETDKNDPIRWLDALLFSKNINFSFDFITLEGRARLLGVEYNRDWRCWTARPTDEQRKEIPWE